MSLPLEGIRVIELAQIIAGPYCAHQLGLFGAEVIKVEPPGTGEFLRQRPPAPAGVNSSWMMFNPGKKSITLNLKHPRAFRASFTLRPRAMRRIADGVRSARWILLCRQRQELSA